MTREELLKIYSPDIVEAMLNICLKIVTNGDITDEEETFLNSAIDSVDSINNVRDIVALQYQRMVISCAKLSAT